MAAPSIASTASQTKSWDLELETKAKGEVSGKEYVLLDATVRDIDKVKNFFYSHPSTAQYQIGSIKVLYNPTLNSSFSTRMKLLDKRHGYPHFDPKWSMNLLDHNLEWRKEVQKRFEKMSEPHRDSDFPFVKLLPVWHGTTAEAVDSICKLGYAHTATPTDAGFFGKGYYGALEGEYSYKKYCKGAFFLNWVAIYSPYPVVLGDQNKLRGKPSFENYDAHFIPVTPRTDNPDEVNFDPCPPFTPHPYNEIVVFDSAAYLPRYLVELHPISITAPRLTPFLLPPLQPSISDSRIPHMPNPPDKASMTPEEQYKKGLEYYQTKDKEGHLELAAKYLRLAADRGHAAAQNSLGNLYYHDGDKVDFLEKFVAVFSSDRKFKIAFEFYKKAADQGFAPAQYNLGLLYLHGKGVGKDYKLAFDWFKKAADQGIALAQNEVGILYIDGGYQYGSEVDPENWTG